MIHLKYLNGVTALKAYTVTELIAELQKHPQDLPVVFAWEGQQIGFGEGRIEQARFDLHTRFGGALESTHTVLEFYAE